jgi:hypothetical protein
MIYKPDPVYMKERSKEILIARNWGIGVISTLLGLGFFISELERIRSVKPDAMNFLYLTLFAVTGMLIFLWIWATQKELDLFFEWLDPERYDPPSTIKETLLILSIAIALIALIFASRNPLWYSVTFSIYCIVGVPVWIYTENEIRIAIEKSKSRVNQDISNNVNIDNAKIYLRAVNTLEAYFLLRPMKMRSYIIAIASVVGLMLGLNWKLTNSYMSGIACYILFIAIIVVSEAIIGYWRVKRDVEIREIAADLRESSRKV